MPEIRQPKRIVLLNGPPRCGKDTVASHLVPYFQFEKMKFAAPLKRMAAALLDMDVSAVERHKDAEFNILCKEIESEDVNFGNKTYTYGQKDTLRRLLINMSEGFLKPHYGDTFFGRVAYRELARSSANLIIFTDSGFAPEASTIIRQCGKQNVLLVRLHRESCTFEGDSRSYLPDISGTNVDVENDGPISHLTGKVARAISKAFGIEPSREIELYDDR